MISIQYELLKMHEKKLNDHEKDEYYNKISLNIQQGKFDIPNISTMKDLELIKRLEQLKTHSDKIVKKGDKEIEKV
jgi:hypothetical protein